MRVIPTVMDMSKSGHRLVTVNFEIFGKVQGVYFRKCTAKQARTLGLKGYCMNTDRGTVQGTIQGADNRVAEMKNWLKEVGSPASRIDKAVFSSEQEISKLQSGSFTIRQ
ncbi:PREDICTED: acylphosphatase-2-like [Nicrophorus vespilloides]|uniref:Acylphosphatase n=1 Tax=Nicrophorus vespilloides TaxID=110193 RepID=A0ABM1N130_NICVS|nr:PREDICTED: acylphosphatase-2-like [Nicrophorus vespilloides]